MKVKEIRRLITNREVADAHRVREIFCNHNLDKEPATSVSYVYVVTCKINPKHTSHIVAKKLMVAVKGEFVNSAITYFSRLEKRAGLTRNELKTVRSKVHSSYLRKEFQSFQQISVTDKNVNKLLGDRNADVAKFVITKPKTRSRLVESLRITKISEEKFHIVTPHQEKTLSSLQIKEFFACYSKKLYITEKEAINSEHLASDETLQAYLCVFCTGYHLGHAPKSDRVHNPGSQFNRRYQFRPQLGEDFLKTIK